MKKDGKKKKVWRVVRRTLLVLFAAAAAFVLFLGVEVFDMGEWDVFDIKRIKDAPRTCQNISRDRRRGELPLQKRG